jgi:hypothetical protein
MVRLAHREETDGYLTTDSYNLSTPASTKAINICQSVSCYPCSSPRSTSTEKEWKKGAF